MCGDCASCGRHRQPLNGCAGTSLSAACQDASQSFDIRVPPTHTDESLGAAEVVVHRTSDGVLVLTLTSVVISATLVARSIWILEQVLEIAAKGDR